MARSIAAAVEPGFALFVPAMLCAVPWSGDVLIMGRPAVALTARSNPMVLIGASAWSWYMATMMSAFPSSACLKTVSPGCGPVTRIPCDCASLIAGMMILCSSSPISPCSPA